MAWTSGFFNSLNGDRKYNAQQMSEIFKGLITDGVYNSVGDKLAVKPSDGMTLHISTGRGWFGGHWVDNSSEYPLTLNSSDVTLNRYAAICVKVDESTSVRSVEPIVKYSSLASSPVKPTVERTETVKEYCLAYVYIKAGALSITSADIEDTRSNTELCGWVTGLIEQVDTTTLWTQFKSEWENLTSEYADTVEGLEADFLQWFNNLQSYLDDNVEATLINDMNEVKSTVAGLKSTVDDQKDHAKKLVLTLEGLNWDSQSDGTYLQTVSVEGVTSKNDLLVTPDINSKEAYNRMGCEAIAQAEGTVTFNCKAPEDLELNVEVIVFNL